MKYERPSGKQTNMNATAWTGRLLAKTRRRAGPLLLVALFVLSAFAVSSAGAAHVSAPSWTGSSGGAPTSGLSPAAAHLLEQSLQLPSVGTPNLAPLGASHFVLGTPSPGAPQVATGQVSTSSNFDISGSSCSHGSTAVQVGSSASTIEAATTSWYPLFNGTGGTPCSTASPSAFWWQYGDNIAVRSTNAGTTWSPVYIPGNVTHWQSSSDGAYGSINAGNPTIAAGSNGVVLIGGYFLQSCDMINGLTCNSTLGGQFAPVGVSVARSTNGGTSFSPAAQVYARPEFQTYKYPNCTNVPQPSFVFYSNITENPVVAYDANSNVGIVAWDILHWALDPSTCNYGFVNTSVMYSLSTDGGITWGTPQLLPSDGGSLYPAVAFGPAPTDAIYVLADDEGTSNSSVASDGNIIISYANWVSTNNGTSFVWKSDAALNSVNLAYSTTSATGGPGYQPNYPDSFYVGTQPILAVDNWSGDAHLGYQYVVWNDNQSGTYAGYPAIRFMEKAPGALAWSSPVTITPTGTSTTYYQPAVAVAPGGTIYVTYLGVNRANGNYREYGVFSSDGGITWSSQFPISDTNSNPTDQQPLGSTTGLAATSAGAIPVWTDCRGTCANSAPESELFAANVHLVNISANAPNVTATISTFGVTTYNLPLPLTQGWDTGSSHTVSVPVWVPLANASFVDSFKNWTGLSTSTNYTTTLTYNGIGNLTANYAGVPASWIAGSFTPFVPKASLRIDNQYLVPLHQVGTSNLSSYNFTVASGSTYSIQAFAPAYQPLSIPNVPTTPHATTVQDITLLKYTGQINGHLSLPTGIPYSAATVTVNSTSVAVGASGLFNATVGWGWYWVRANVTGLTNFSEYLQVFPNQSAPVSVVLNGGWIEGNILTPVHISSGFRLAIDGILVPNITAGGTFNVTERGGFHTLTATQPGYNLTVINDINVVPGYATIVNINLTNHGWITGAIGPTAILTSASTRLTVSNRTAGGNFWPYNPTTGEFNVSLLGGYNWTVNVSSTGYYSFQTILYVSPGNQSGLPLVINLQKIPGQCTGPNCNGNNNTTPPNGPGTTTAAFPTTLVVGIVAVVLIVAIALVLLLRRRGGGSAPAEPSEEPGAEGETIYGNAPPAEETGEPPAQ